MKNVRFLFVMGFLLSASFLAAQEFTGRVTDSTGASIPMAAITVHNVLTGIDIKSSSTSTGDYTVPYLRPGSYEVRAEAAGFAMLIRSGLILQVGETSTVNFDLRPGTVTESVTVNADTYIDFGKADRGEVVENARVTELPLNGRDPGMLSTLNAGAVWLGSIQWQRPFDDTQANLSINGGGKGNNAMLLDGVTNESSGGNSKIGYVPPVDSVREFKIVTNPYDSQYGRAQGGVVDMTLKSGTNNLHGDVYEFARRAWLDADTWRSDWLNAKNPGVSHKGQHKLDQWGAELDGPVFLPKFYDGRSKSFFLLQYENWNEVVPNNIVTSVPDPAWLTGDFSNLTYWDGSKIAPMYIYDPLTLHDDGTGKGILVRDRFPGNKIPTVRINPVALNMLSYYPKPNLAPSAGTNPFANNYTTPNPTTDIYRNVLGKWDENVGASDRFSLRYGYWERLEVRGTNGMPGAAAQGASPFVQRSHTFATDWVHTFASNLLLDVRGSVIVRNDSWHDGPGGFDPSSLGWSAAMVGQLGQGTQHFPRMGVSEFAGLGNGGVSGEVNNSVALVPNLTWILNKHTLHLGMDIRALQKAITSVQPLGPNFWVDRKWTQSNYIGSQWTPDSGSSIASMLLGTMSSGGTNIAPQAYWSQHYYAPFVQDDWKVTRKLTLNLGVRYDLNGPQVERHDRMDYAFDPNMVNPIDAQINHASIPGGAPIKGGITFVGVNGNPRSFYSIVKTNVQPRVGFAYAIDDRTVVRGGIGEMFRNPIPGGNQYGWSANTSYVGSTNGDRTPLMNLSNPFPTIVQPTGSSLGALTGLGQSPYFINPSYKTPGFWSYSFGFQHQFLKADTLEISFVGSHSYNQDSSDNINHWSTASQTACNIEMGGNRHLCDDQSNWVTNPFYHVAAFQGTGLYSSQTIQPQSLAAPFPEFGSITEWQLNDGTSTFNSLQVTGVHRWRKDLTLHGTWTWSKIMNAGGFADDTYRIAAHSIDGNDRTHRITLSSVYYLPVGRGRTFLGSTNRLLDTAVGGWEVGSLFIYETGTPWGVPNNPNEEYVGNASLPRTIDPVTGYIRGVAACIASTNSETGAHTMLTNQTYKGCKQPFFVNRPSYAANPNVVYTGIRLPSNFQFDANLSKNFSILENLKLQFRLESFNVLNHPLWQSGYAGSANDPNFGTIQRGPWDQSNLPRQTQIALKLMW